MLFKDNFYTIQNKSEQDGSLIYRIQLDKNHRIFEGHFPDNPVTPGVVQLEIVKELINDHTGENYRLDTMGNCKFLAILNPQATDTVDVQLSLSETDEGDLKASALIKSDAEMFFKMGATYKHS